MRVCCECDSNIDRATFICCFSNAILITHSSEFCVTSPAKLDNHAAVVGAIVSAVQQQLQRTVASTDLLAIGLDLAYTLKMHTCNKIGLDRRKVNIFLPTNYH